MNSNICTHRPTKKQQRATPHGRLPDECYSRGVLLKNGNGSKYDPVEEKKKGRR